MTRDDLLRLRDQIYVTLLVREGQQLDARCASEEANNIAAWLEAEIDDIVNQALKEAARGVVVVGEIGAQPKEPQPEDWRDDPTVTAIK